jgi:hydroxyacylglutathione hydrolase
MHRDDRGMAEQGDMFVNRQKPCLIARLLLPLLSGFGRKERFTPDLFVSDGDDLSAFGLDARILSLPGHSKGSIGLLTASGDLFCGDFFENSKAPALNSLMDDPAAARASLETLKSLQIKTVYPAHGRPFEMDLLLRNIPGAA